MWAGQGKALFEPRKHSPCSEGTRGRGKDACALKVMRDSCVHSDFKIIMALESKRKWDNIMSFWKITLHSHV